ncbi:hypothetical protein [Collinsella sp. An2]|uniref:AAA family ATPase n=1 Tax=Collinsella sp. An2 TaxID=1965585 RepID=UPI000B38D78F|nr:hypothetical protein [Collinsella sp. An2]OUP07437.1 hypothetical protein B5F33_08810 [Collinsella sp. An2]
MRSVWFVCCALEDYEFVRHEVMDRDPSAQLLRVGHLDSLLAMVGALPRLNGGVMLWLRGIDGGLLSQVVRTLVEGAAKRVVVGIEVLDPSNIVRCLEAGATEVVVMQDAEPESGRAMWACMDEEPPTMRAAASGPGDEVGATSASKRRGRRSGDEAVVREAWASVEDEPPWDEYIEVLEKQDSDGAAARAPETSEVLGAEGRFEGVARPEVDAERRCEEAPGGHDERTAAGESEERGIQAEESALGEGSTRTEESARVEAPARTEGPARGEGLARPAEATRTGTTICDRASARGEGTVPGAPVIACLSGRGGCGLTTIVASLALVASHLGLRTAVLDLDLMFGNLYTMLGADGLHDLGLLAAGKQGELTEEDIVRTSMRIGPNLTVWGPVSLPEQAEVMGPAVEELLDVLREEADVIFVDTSTHWSDPVAAAVSQADRCLLVGDTSVATASSLARVIELAGRVGVPRTRMTSVFNRFGAPGCGEDAAMRFEVSVALSSRARIADGGADVRELASFGRVDELIAKPGAFSESVQALACDVLRELGCPVQGQPAASAVPERHQRLRLPWHKVAGEKR